MVTNQMRSLKELIEVASLASVAGVCVSLWMCLVFLSQLKKWCFDLVDAVMEGHFDADEHCVECEGCKTQQQSVTVEELRLTRKSRELFGG